MTLAIIMLAGLALWLLAVFALRRKRYSLIRLICPGEMLILKTAEDRKRACDRGTTAFLKHRGTWTAVVIYTAAILLTTGVILGFGEIGIQVAQASLAGKLFTTFVPIGCAAMLIPLMGMRYRSWMRAFLREYLNDHGIPICNECGYDLRGGTKSRCPECGTAILPN